MISEELKIIPCNFDITYAPLKCRLINKKIKKFTLRNGKLTSEARRLRNVTACIVSRKTHSIIKLSESTLIKTKGVRLWTRKMRKSLIY